MLTELTIRNIVLIEKLRIAFDGGLSVLTGETGAGKSILLDSLALALGARGDASLVRNGEEQGSVTAVFDLPKSHTARMMLRDADVDLDDGEPLMLRRVQNSDGRTRAFVNDQSVSAGLLKQLGAALVEIHGQHDDRALVDAESHRQLLDAYGQLQSDVSHVEALYRGWRGAERELVAHRKRVEEAEREADFLRASAEELGKLAPVPGEETQLSEKRTDMMRLEKVASDLNEADEVLSGNASPVPAIAGLLRRLERKAEDVPGLLEETNEHLARALDHLSEAQNLIQKAVNDSEFNPKDLEQTEERLFSLRAAARKYNVPVDDLGDLAVKMADQLADLDAGEARLALLEKAAREALEMYDRAAKELSSKRAEAGAALEQAVMAELPELKLEKARFIVAQTSDESTRSASGMDVVEFHVQTNPGTRAGPMMKVASGGELSRFLLALKVALADKGSAPTLVFDEIDTGVGGAVSAAIGQRLKRLSGQVQVLTVTHAPQVAARAFAHYLISKSGTDAMATSVALMDEAARREEIARMLSGASVTAEARAAAEQLLKAG